LTKAHLPKSITNLKLTEPVALTKLLNKTQVEEMYNTKVFTNGLYLEDLLE
jgi:hypothetical protein